MNFVIPCICADSYWVSYAVIRISYISILSYKIVQASLGYEGHTAFSTLSVVGSYRCTAMSNGMWCTSMGRFKMNVFYLWTCSVIWLTFITPSFQNEHAPTSIVTLPDFRYMLCQQNPKFQQINGPCKGCVICMQAQICGNFTKVSLPSNVLCAVCMVNLVCRD